MELPLPYANSDGTSSIRVDIYRRNCACQFSIRQDSLSLSFTTSMRRNAQLKIALDLSMGRERFNCQENCKVAGRGVMPKGQPPAEYGCRSKAAAPTKTTALWMVCCAALAGAGCQRRCKPHIRSGTRRQTASGCKCFPKR